MAGDDRDDRDDLAREDLAFLRELEGLGAAPLPQRSAAKPKAPAATPGPDEGEDRLFERHMETWRDGPSPELPEAAPPAPVPPPKPAAAASDPGERTLRRRLKRGEIVPTAEMDLHGRRRDVAIQALGVFLQRTRAEGHETVLVITGRGLHSPQLGVLRELVPIELMRRWPDHVRRVLPAPPRLGGEGAFVVFLKTR